jgi:hypothetical protein
MEKNKPLNYRVDIFLDFSRFESGNALKTPELNGQTGFLYLVNGSVTVSDNDKTLI